MLGGSGTVHTPIGPVSVPRIIVFALCPSLCGQISQQVNPLTVSDEFVCDLCIQT